VVILVKIRYPQSYWEDHLYHYRVWYMTLHHIITEYPLLEEETKKSQKII